LALALIPIVTLQAWKDTRARMALAFGIVGIALSFGANLPGYEWLQEHVPLMQGIRAASRWGGLFLIAIAILGGFGVASLAQRWQSRRWWMPFAALLVGAVTVEAIRAPLTLHQFDDIPAVHARLAQDHVKAIVVFPLYGGREFNLNAGYLLHQTKHWKPMLNGYSSFAPPLFFELADKLQAFPTAAAIHELRSHGFTHVVLHRPPLEQAFGRAAVDALRAHPELQFEWEEDGVVVYRVL
jgi:hypothetical protein